MIPLQKNRQDDLSNALTALALADRTLAIDPYHGWAWELKITINERLMLYAEALKVLEQARQRARDNPGYTVETKQQEIDQYDRREQAIRQKM